MGENSEGGDTSSFRKGRSQRALGDVTDKKMMIFLSRVLRESLPDGTSTHTKALGVGGNKESKLRQT